MNGRRGQSGARVAARRSYNNNHTPCNDDGPFYRRPTERPLPIWRASQANETRGANRAPETRRPTPGAMPVRGHRLSGRRPPIALYRGTFGRRGHSGPTAAPRPATDGAPALPLATEAQPGRRRARGEKPRCIQTSSALYNTSRVPIRVRQLGALPFRFSLAFALASQPPPPASHLLRPLLVRRLSWTPGAGDESSGIIGGIGHRSSRPHRMITKGEARGSSRILFASERPIRRQRARPAHAKQPNEGLKLARLSLWAQGLQRAHCAATRSRAPNWRRGEGILIIRMRGGLAGSACEIGGGGHQLARNSPRMALAQIDERASRSPGLAS